MPTFQDVIDATKTKLATLGVFVDVKGHEPKGKPGLDLRAAVWVAGVRPASSGLAAVSPALDLTIRLYLPMSDGLSVEQQDEVDPRLTNAVDDVFRALCADLTLGGRVRTVDVFGMDGEGLRAVPGYLTYDQALYRVFTITMPCVINDQWTEVQ